MAHFAFVWSKSQMSHHKNWNGLLESWIKITSTKKTKVYYSCFSSTLAYYQLCVPMQAT